MATLDQIKRLSNWMFWACTVLAYALPAVVILAILRGWFDPEAVVLRFPNLPEGTQATAFQGALVAIVGVLSVYPITLAFLRMRNLFTRYRKGDILTEPCARDILRIGQALFVVAAMTVVVPTLQVLILSWNNPPGGRILSVGLDGSTLGFLLSGGLLIVIGWVMREAAQAAEDAKGFV
jgi:amino acid transporter